MPPNTAPVFTLTPRIGAATLSATADTSYTTPANAVSILAAGTNGTRVEEVSLFGTGATVAGVCQLYVYDGTSHHAIDSVAVTAVTPSPTQPPYTFKLTFQNLVLPSGWSLVATSFVASQLLNVVAFGGDF